MIATSPGPATLRALLQDTFENGATVEPADVRAARREALLARFRAVDEDLAALSRSRERVLAALPAERRAGWLGGVQAALSVRLGVARRSSRIMLEPLRSLFAPNPAAWSLVPAHALSLRGNPAPARVETTDGRMSVAIDDSGESRRIIATIRDVPETFAAPVLLIVAGDGSVIAEVEPEVLIEASRRRLRYAAELPPGEYDLFLGNPRASALGGGGAAR